MKPVIISISMLLLICLLMTFAYAQPPGYGPPQQVPSKAQEHRHKERKQATDANSGVDANSTVDVNDVNAPAEANEPKYKMYEGLDDEITQLDQDGEKEMREWIRMDTENRVENRIKLIESSQEQALAELQLARKLAEEEKAEKTIAAIDGLIANRQKRFDDAKEKLERRRLQDKERKREDRRTRGTRDRESTRRTRPETRTTRPGGPGAGGPPIE